MSSSSSATLSSSPGPSTKRPRFEASNEDGDGIHLDRISKKSRSSKEDSFMTSSAAKCDGGTKERKKRNRRKKRKVSVVSAEDAVRRAKIAGTPLRRGSDAQALVSFPVEAGESSSSRSLTNGDSYEHDLTDAGVVLSPFPNNK